LANARSYSEEELEKEIKFYLAKDVHSEDLPEITTDLGQLFQKQSWKRSIPKTTHQSNEMIWSLGFGKTTRRSKRRDSFESTRMFVDISSPKKQETWMQRASNFF